MLQASSLKEQKAPEAEPRGTHHGFAGCGSHFGYGSKLKQLDRRFRSMSPLTRATHLGYLFLTHSHMSSYVGKAAYVGSSCFCTTFFFQGIQPAGTLWVYLLCEQLWSSLWCPFKPAPKNSTIQKPEPRTRHLYRPLPAPSE